MITESGIITQIEENRHHFPSLHIFFRDWSIAAEELQRRSIPQISAIRIRQCHPPSSDLRSDIIILSSFGLHFNNGTVHLRIEMMNHIAR